MRKNAHSLCARTRINDGVSPPPPPPPQDASSGHPKNLSRFLPSSPLLLRDWMMEKKKVFFSLSLSFWCGNQNNWRLRFGGEKEWKWAIEEEPKRGENGCGDVEEEGGGG